MLATNMAPVSLSTSLFSVTMYSLGLSPWLLTMSFHILLLHTRSCSQQAVTQFLCLKVKPRFAVNALSAHVRVMKNMLSAFPSDHWQCNDLRVCSYYLVSGILCTGGIRMNPVFFQISVMHILI